MKRWMIALGVVLASSLVSVAVWHQAANPAPIGLLYSVDDGATLTLYEGLPHSGWEKEVYASELEHKNTVTRHGFAFYEATLPVSDEDVAALRLLVQNREIFMDWRGDKACGGYHPDYSLVWENEGESIEFQICFGCYEVKVYGGKDDQYLDLRAESFEAILTKYRDQRPEEQF